jgi:hypothetical protein
MGHRAHLHDGSAPTLTDAVRAHSGVELNADQLRQITAYLRELGREEGPASAPVGEGTGLVGRYFNNMTLSGNPVFTREENIDFNWKLNKPAPGVNANGFSVRWNGELEVPVTGTYYLQTVVTMHPSVREPTAADRSLGQRRSAITDTNNARTHSGQRCASCSITTTTPASVARLHTAGPDQLRGYSDTADASHRLTRFIRAAEGRRGRSVPVPRH